MAIVPVVSGAEILESLQGNEYIEVIAGGSIKQVATTDTIASLAGGSGGRILPFHQVTSGAAYQMTATDYEVYVNKASPSATEIDLPPTPVAGQLARVTDGRGDAGTNNITVKPAGGGSTIYVMNVNGQTLLFRYTGSAWGLV